MPGSVLHSRWASSLAVILNTHAVYSLGLVLSMAKTNHELGAMTTEELPLPVMIKGRHVAKWQDSGCSTSSTRALARIKSSPDRGVSGSSGRKRAIAWAVLARHHCECE